MPAKGPDAGHLPPTLVMAEADDAAHELERSGLRLYLLNTLIGGHQRRPLQHRQKWLLSHHPFHGARCRRRAGHLLQAGRWGRGAATAQGCCCEGAHLPALQRPPSHAHSLILSRAATAAHDGIPFFELVLARSATLVLLTIPLLARAHINPFGHHDKGWLLLLRGVFGFASISAWYWSLSLLPMSDVNALGAWVGG